jgi:hypothetical protein
MASHVVRYHARLGLLRATHERTLICDSWPSSGRRAMLGEVRLVFEISRKGKMPFRWYARSCADGLPTKRPAWPD